MDRPLNLSYNVITAVQLSRTRVTTLCLWKADELLYVCRLQWLIRLPDVNRQGLIVLPINFLFLSIHRAQQPRSEWPSNVFRRLGRSKTSTIAIVISSTPPLIFTGVKKCEIWCRFQHHSALSRSRLKTQQEIWNLKHISRVGMIATCLCQVWWSWVHAPLRTVCQSCPIP